VAVNGRIWAMSISLFYKQKGIENNLRRMGHLNLPQQIPFGSKKQLFSIEIEMEFSFFRTVAWLNLG